MATSTNSKNGNSKPLKLALLKHFKDHGPHNYGGICVLFDVNRTAAIQPVLQELLDWDYIRWQAGDNKILEITNGGLTLLANRRYWAQ